MAQDSFDALKPGTVIGEKYRISRLLGQGGMGAVYEAENTWTTRRVAIKLLHPMFTSDPVAVERFKGEAQAATRLAHPNIVDVLDMGADGQTGALYIVQEFLHGKDLYAYFEERKQLSPPEAAELLVPVMAALAIAHAQGIIHRDIKPENIFLVETGSDLLPKLIDFGLSKVLGESAASRKTTTGTVMGTPYYMSPEQVRGDRAIDARTDVWAMGAVMFELIAGKVPFDDASANLLMFKIMSEPPPRIETFVPDINPAVAEVIHHAMEPDLVKRYPSVREMLDALLACPGFEHVNRKTTLRERFSRSIEHRPPSISTAPTLPPATTSVPPKVASGPMPASTPEPARTTRDDMVGSRPVSVVRPPRRIQVAALVAVAVACVALVGWRLTLSPSTTAAPTAAHAAQPPAAVPAPVVPTPVVPASVAAALVAPVAPQAGGAADAAVALAANPSGAAAGSAHGPSHHHRHHGGGNELVPVAPP